MKKVLFICCGNICRSVSAEYIMKDLAKKNGVDLYVSSAATSREEIGNDIYPPAKRKLKEKGIPFSRHYARQATMSDYLSYDYLICMDENNMRNLNRMFNNDPDHKIYKLLSRDVSDPWYSNDFETAYNDMQEYARENWSQYIESGQLRVGLNYVQNRTSFDNSGICFSKHDIIKNEIKSQNNW